MAYYASLAKGDNFESITKEDNPLLLAAVAGSTITRMASNSAFKLKGRGLSLPDVLENYNIEEYLELLELS